MKKMKSLLIVSVIVTACLVGCGRHEEIVEPVEKAESVDVVETEGAEDVAETVNEEVPTDTESDPLTMDAVLSVMVNDTLYMDTGYVSRIGRCGNLDGEITEVIPRSEIPTQNGQANFEGATGWQYGSDEGTVDVYCNNEWHVFATAERSTPGYIPSGVPHFMAMITQIPEGVAFDSESIKEGHIIVEAMGENWFGISAGTEYDVSTEHMELLSENQEVVVGNVVEIWFGGSVLEVYPGILCDVYKVEFVHGSPAEMLAE